MNAIVQMVINLQWKWSCALRLTSSSMAITHDNNQQCVRDHCSCLSLLQRRRSERKNRSISFNFILFLLTVMHIFQCCCFLFVCHLPNLIMFTSTKRIGEFLPGMIERNKQLSIWKCFKCTNFKAFCAVWNTWKTASWRQGFAAYKARLNMNTFYFKSNTARCYTMYYARELRLFVPSAFVTPGFTPCFPRSG
jgi:hypothetical protein